MDARRFALNLALTPGVGGRTLVRVLSRIELLGQSPDEFLKLSEEDMRESYGLIARVAKTICQQRGAWPTKETETELRLAARNVQLVTAIDAHFPARIDAFDPNGPAVLFLYGNSKLLERPTFCVLSSRKTTRKGLDLIEKLTEEGIFQAEVVVTGHDTPEYQRSAIVPLRWGSPRILCLDQGLFHVFGEDLNQEPFRAARLWRYQFDPLTDLAISPFKPESRFHGVHNQIRDRLVASLSDRLDFVEVSEGGNMEALVKLGLKAGRRVRVSDRAEIGPRLANAGAETIET